MTSKQHWETVYTTKATDEVSWFQNHAELFLKIIRDSGVALSGKIIDVGGGASHWSTICWTVATATSLSSIYLARHCARQAPDWGEVRFRDMVGGQHSRGESARQPL